MTDETSLYHAAPLHYLPHVLKCHALYAKSVLALQKIAPRVGAARRDRMLGLENWVHLSLQPDTPLLRDKLVRGFSHALLVFDRPAVLALPEVALLPYNTKAWRSRSVFVPVTDPLEKAALLRKRVETGRYPSLEVLVQYGLSLDLLTQAAFAEETERHMVQETLAALDISCPFPLVVNPDLFPLPQRYQPTTRAAIAAYFAACQESASLLPPPFIPFD